ncbi:hypothetical protein FACS189423_09240 [Bacteroidia bacterium]|nr:hypothetical protein FACS189423_09240 [Bacteroidia bacterium]
MIVSSYWLVDSFTDAKFIDAWKYIPLLSLAVFFNALSTFVGVTFSVTKKTKYFFTSSIWAAFVALALNFLLIPKWGLMGAALSIFFANATMFVMRLNKSWQFSPITGGWRYLISFALCTTLIPEMSINNIYLKIGLMFITFAFWIWNQQYILNPIVLLKDIYKKYANRFHPHI